MSFDPALLEQVASSSASGGGNNIPDGKYRWCIKKVTLEKKYKGTSFIAELEAVTSKENEAGVLPLPVGGVGSYVCIIDNPKTPNAKGNMKAFVLALYGEEEKDVAAGAGKEGFLMCMNLLVGPTQPARGMVLDDITYRKIIKTGENAGKPFVGHNWIHVALDDENTPDKIAARRAKFDKDGTLAELVAA